MNPTCFALLALTLLGPGCPWVSAGDHQARHDELAQSDSDTSHSVGSIGIDAVEPPYGVTTGGDEVTVRGGPFDHSTVVTFGDNVADVLNLTDSSIRVRTPAADEAATVDVRVDTDDGFGVLHDGFVYLADGRGKYGAVGWYNWTIHVGDYWKPTPDPFGHAGVAFIQPKELDILALYGPSVETCEASFTHSETMETWDLGAEEIQLTGPTGTEVTLPWNGGHGYFERLFDEDPLRTDEYQVDSTYDLDPVDCPLEVAVSGFIRTPDDFTILEPAITGENPILLAQSELAFHWDGTGADRMFFTFYMMNAQGALDYTLVCSAYDDGSFTVPIAVWPAWEEGRQVSVELMRARLPDAEIAFNHADVGVIGTYSEIGAFFTD